MLCFFESGFITQYRNPFPGACMKSVFIFILFSWFSLQAEGKSQKKISSTKKSASSVVKKKSASKKSKRFLLYNMTKKRKLAGGGESVCTDSFEGIYKSSFVVFSVHCPVERGDACSGGVAWRVMSECQNNQLKQYYCGSPSATEESTKTHDCEYGCHTNELHCLEFPSG